MTLSKATFNNLTGSVFYGVEIIFQYELKSLMRLAPSNSQNPTKYSRGYNFIVILLKKI